MRLRRIGVYVLLACGAASCGSSPTSPAGSVTVTTAAALAPANGAQISNAAQPVTLSIHNALVTDSSASVSYTFEVATDAGFANKVVTRDVPQSAGQTSLKLDPLAAGRDYYWHVRTTGADTIGVFTSTLKFTIGPAVVVQAPNVASPAGSAASVPQRPTLTVTNAVHTGPVGGGLVYRFDIATSNTFATIIASGTVPEGSGQTSFTPTADLHKVVYLKGPDISDWKQTAFLQLVEQDADDAERPRTLQRRRAAVA